VSDLAWFCFWVAFVGALMLAGQCVRGIDDGAARELDLRGSE
jgi:hypothetical protein